MLYSFQNFNLRWFVVAAFCFGFWCSHWWSLGWELRQEESFLLSLPAVERRAFHLFPLSRCRWPGSRPTTGIGRCSLLISKHLRPVKATVRAIRQTRPRDALVYREVLSLTLTCRLVWQTGKKFALGQSSDQLQAPARLLVFPDTLWGAAEETGCLRWGTRRTNSHCWHKAAPSGWWFAVEPERPEEVGTISMRSTSLWKKDIFLTIETRNGSNCPEITKEYGVR